MKNPIKYLGNELKYIQSVLESKEWSSNAGSWTNVLEKEFAKEIGVKYAIAMNSGTSTLHCALEAVGVKPGDEVITPALTVIMDTTAILHANAIPVYVDVDPITLTMNPNDLKNKITNKTKAIILVSLYGMPFDFDAIKEVAGDIPIIEDNAQALFSSYKGKLLGTMGDMSSYSFENTKHISCGEGGMLVTNNEQLAITARKISNHGFKAQSAIDGRVKLNKEVFQDPDYKRHDCVGWNYRLSEFNAAIALAQLERRKELISLRQKSAAMFLDVMPEYMFGRQDAFYKHEHTYYTLGVVYEGDWRSFRRFYVDAGGDGIYAAWSVPYLEPVMATGEFVKRNPIIYENIKYEKGLCPVAEKLQPKIMQFKTNYRDLELAKMKTLILKKVINDRH